MRLRSQVLSQIGIIAVKVKAKEQHRGAQQHIYRLLKIMARLAWIGAVLLAASTAEAAAEADASDKESLRRYPNEIVHLEGHHFTEKV